MTSAAGVVGVGAVAGGVTVTEVRVLEGPNLYFTRPAVKISLRVPGYLALDGSQASALARRLGLGSSRPGRAGSAQRQRFVMRVAGQVMRRMARVAGIPRLGVRARTGSAVDEIVVAIPWRHRNRGTIAAEQFGPLLGALLGAAEEEVDPVFERVGRRVREAPAGAVPTLIVPRVPVASITGTNGKTTTTRMVAHLAMTAGLRTAWSSTDGVVVMGEMVDPGDFSGPTGAREVLATPGLEIAVLETARGGLLLKGMGVAVNDVSVVTNVTADHLGLHGIETLDQLAEVKAIVTTVTRPSGWVVLNGDDPRVWSMRHRIRARPWAFSLDPDSPALRESIDSGGRGITVLDGELVVLTPGADPDRLAKVVDVPVTLAGLSRSNIANALAAAAAALGLGVPRAAVVEGLRTFLPDPVLSSGRMNTYSVPLPSGGQASVIVDLAHNEAGLEALLEVCHGLVAPGGRVHLGLGGTGDRADEAIQALGEIAGRDADRVVLAHKPAYLRGRSLEDLEQQLRTGLVRSGVLDVESHRTETGALSALLAAAADGDVVALMCHAERPAVERLLRDLGASADDSRAVRRKVVAARGEHESESEIAAIWADDDPVRRVSRAEQLSRTHPRDPRLRYEWALTLDSAGDLEAAIPLYLTSLGNGLREPHRHRAQIQAASAYRSLAQPGAALRLLAGVSAGKPQGPTVIALRALALLDSGRAPEAVADLVDALVDHATDEDTLAYRGALHAYAAAARRPGTH